MLISQCHFDGPPRAQNPSAGPAEANGLLEVHGPRGHCTPCPPLLVALVKPKTCKLVFTAFLLDVQH